MDAAALDDIFPVGGLEAAHLGRQPVDQHRRTDIEIDAEMEVFPEEAVRLPGLLFQAFPVLHIQDDRVDCPAPPLQRDDMVGVGGAVEHLREDVENAVVQFPVGPAGNGGLGEVDGAEHRQHRQVFRPFLSRPVPLHQPLLGGPGDDLGVGRDFLGNQVQPELPPEESAVLLPVAAVIDIPFLHPHRLDHIDRPPEGVLQLGRRAHLADKIDGIQLDRRLGVVEAGVVGEEDVAGLIALFPHPA